MPDRAGSAISGHTAGVDRSERHGGPAPRRATIAGIAAWVSCWQDCPTRAAGKLGELPGGVGTAQVSNPYGRSRTLTARRSSMAA
jgi:hypothetical protein